MKHHRLWKLRALCMLTNQTAGVGPTNVRAVSTFFKVLTFECGDVTLSFMKLTVENCTMELHKIINYLIMS